MVKTPLFLIGCLMFLPASKCMGPEIQLVSPRIPNELREPVPVPDRDASTLKDIGLLLVDYDEALGDANSKIVATDEILTKFEAKIAAPQ